MGEKKKLPLRVEFDREIKLEFHGPKVSSNGGLLIYRELDEALGLTDLAETMLSELRVAKNTQHTLKALFLQPVYSRLAGYEDTNDAERLRVDPTVRRLVGGPVKDRTSASTSEIGRFETELWVTDENFAVLIEQRGAWHRQSQLPRWDREVRLQLFALAYSLANFVGRLALPRSIKHWSLTTLREKLIEMGAKVVSGSRNVTFQLAEVAVPRSLFEAILSRIQRLRLAHGPG